MKNAFSSVKNKIVSRYSLTDNNESQKKSTDINILKSKLQKNEDKQFKKNLAVFISFVAGLGALGIYLST